MATVDGNTLKLDCEAEIARIGKRTKELLRKMRRRGLVLGVSGGVDSSVCCALAAKNIGAKRVFALLMPESDSSSWSVELGKRVCEQAGVEYELVNIAPTLEAIGCYKARDEAITAVFPEYGEGWKNKIAIAGGINQGINYFNLVVQSPDGEVKTERLPLEQYLKIVAATNFKQRIRKTLEYYHADRLNFAVLGTPNRLEYDQGFFVKNGDGAADIKPITHLYKTQVFQLAAHLDLPREIVEGRPTTDTYSMPQEQDEFYFALPYEKMDLALWAFNHNVAAEELAKAIEVDTRTAELVYKDIVAKRQTTRYLHLKGQLIAPVEELDL